MSRILVINPGSTSTKVALYENENCVYSENIKVDLELIQNSKVIVDQFPERAKQIEDFLRRHGLAVRDLDIIAARGGLLPPCEGRAYAVNQLMIDVLTYAAKGQHASSLACMIGNRLAEGTEVPVIIYDPLTVDEMDRFARVTGLPQIEFETVAHVLNSRKVSREVAAKLGVPYEKGRFIVAHLGGGVSITAHRDGRLVDYASSDTGPMSPERSGALPNGPLVDLCFSGKYTHDEIHKLLIGRGGFMAYLGTQDALEVENMALAGNEQAQTLYGAMSYQVAKSIGSLYASAMESRVDAIIFTGALSKSSYLIDPIIERIKPLGHIEILAGEREMDALAEGAIRVLSGVEKAKEYQTLPQRFDTVSEFYDFVATQKKG